ncbi:TPA: hypothetical protein DCZ15_01770 [Candidatus Falkowbacteria bacterium]|nr:MAG: hypothetical protein UV95_C0004G0018 [Candidatus Falkowbacteria bacterium GW2011_GWF2_43_32]HBA36584.1 hypothetical protein [Candidatus Falkowbacteria bacterium]
MAETDKTEGEKLESLLRDNLESTAKILKDIRFIKKSLRWQRIWSVFRFLLIVVPIILGFIYLPPLIKETLETYRNLLIR